MRNQSITKLESIRIQNMKNVEDGQISFLKNLTQRDMNGIVNVTGIYGQNGSGKTAVIDALSLIQKLLTGQPIANREKGYIREGASEMVLTLNWLTKDSKCKTEIEYMVAIGVDENKIFISKEKLSASYRSETVKRNLAPLIDYKKGNAETFLGPSKRMNYYSDLSVDERMERMVDLRIAKREAEGEISYGEEIKDTVSNQKIRSFIFNPISLKHFIYDRISKEDILPEVSKTLFFYATKKMAVVEMNENFFIMSDVSQIVFPIDLRHYGEERISYVSLNLDEDNKVSIQKYKVIKHNIRLINEILETLVPGCNLGICDQKNDVLDDGEPAMSFKITSIRNGKQIPFSCESAGIRKIIILATKLMNYYNDPSYLLVIDEFDTGIFEYLLGEIVDVMLEGAKGQLLFTCHNLHSMEQLEKENIVFTTTNSTKRYLRPKNINKNKNLRLTYLASLKLGGQEEELYSDTDKRDFAIALEDAYEEV